METLHLIVNRRQLMLVTSKNCRQRSTDENIKKWMGFRFVIVESNKGTCKLNLKKVLSIFHVCTVYFLAIIPSVLSKKLQNIISVNQH